MYHNKEVAVGTVKTESRREIADPNDLHHSLNSHQLSIDPCYCRHIN